MLILTRKLGEKTYVTYPDGTVGTITIVSFDRGRVRLGFKFPSHVNIARREVYEPPVRKERSDVNSSLRQDQKTTDPAIQEAK